MKATELLIEETLPNDSGYSVLWRGKSFTEAFDNLESLPNSGRLELWSKAHAESPMGFAPMAFRAAGSARVMVSNLLSIIPKARAGW